MLFPILNSALQGGCDHSSESQRRDVKMMRGEENAQGEYHQCDHEGRVHRTGVQAPSSGAQ